MRTKFISAIITTVLLSGIIFLACHKKDQTLSPEQSNEVAFRKETKKWWYSTFVKSAEFAKTDWSSPLAPPSGSSTKKYPRWNGAKTYSLGKNQVVEMPLQKETNSILMPGMQKLENTAEGLKVATAAIHKLLLFKKPNGTRAVRTVTIVPSPEYAKKMNYDMSHISLKKLPDDFSGYLMIAGWDGSKKNIIRFEAGKKPQTVKIITGEAYRARKAVTSAQADWVCDYIWVPDLVWVCFYSPTGDDEEDDRLCEENGYWDDQGYYEEVNCREEPDPDEDPDPFQECLDNGGSYEECECQVYDICEPDCSDPSYTTETTSDPYNYFVSGNAIYAKVTHTVSNSCNGQTSQYVTDEYQPDATAIYLDGLYALNNGQQGLNVSANGSTEYFDDNGVEKRNASPKWQYYTARFYSATRLEFSAFFNAVHFKSGGTWKFESLTYLSTGLTDGMMPACHDFTVTVNTHTINIAADQLTARVSFNYTVSDKLPCLFNVNVGTRNHSISRDFTTSEGVQ